MTIPEMLIALGLGSLLFLAMLSFSAFSGRSFAAMVNYTELDAKSRKALDLLSRDIRRADQLASLTTNRIELIDSAGARTVYAYDTSGKTLSRTAGGSSKELLSGVSSLAFNMYQRTSISNSFEQFTNASVATAKVVQINWVCTRTVLGTRQNTESVQSAKIVLRQK